MRLKTRFVTAALALVTFACGSRPAPTSRALPLGNDADELSEEEQFEAFLRDGDVPKDSSLDPANVGMEPDEYAMTDEAQRLLPQTCGSPQSLPFCTQTTAAYVNTYKGGGGACARGGNAHPWLSDDADVDGNYASLKAMVWNLAYDLKRKSGNPSCWADMAISSVMQEHGSIPEPRFEVTLPYDPSKDGTSDGSQNVSVFNMNVDYIFGSCAKLYGESNAWCKWFGPKRPVWGDQSTKKYLNKAQYLPSAVRRFLEGADHFGQKGALAFHRGGRACYPTPDEDCQEFVNATLDQMDRVNTGGHQTDSMRIAHCIDWRGNSGTRSTCGRRF